MSHLITAILTENEAGHIGACLSTVQWTDGALIQDHFSDDNTVAIATAVGATVFQAPFINFSIARNNALKNAQQLGADWVLFVDADERITPALALEIQQMLATNPEIVGWWIPRYNLMWGHTMQGGGWYPDYQLRLLKVSAAHYDPTREVHECAELDGPAGYLQEHLLHYNYSSLAHFKQKQWAYAQFEAHILKEQGIRAKPWTYLTMPLREFWRRFITLQGYQDRLLGLHLCSLMGWYKLQTYLTLRNL